TLALMGVPLNKWELYNEPAHAQVYTPAGSPDEHRVGEMYMTMAVDLMTHMSEIRNNHRSGLLDAGMGLRIDGQPAPDIEILGVLTLLIGGGFDTTTALSAHSLEWPSETPDPRLRL